MAAADPPAGHPDFLTFPDFAVREAAQRLPDLDAEAMSLVMHLHRLTSALVYDLESAVHRPAGWSWAGFRVLFVLWIAGPLDGMRTAALSGMSRASVSSLVNTLERDGLVRRDPQPNDARAVLLSLSARGELAMEKAFVSHNAREAAWAGVLDDHDREALVELLTKFAHAAHADWVHRRS